MSRLSATDVRCVIFASALQQSDSPSADMVASAISSVLADLGLTGCLNRLAQEFGDHPDAACERMRWAGRLTGDQQTVELEAAG
ncbi:MAG: hypothetical protein WBH47_01010 [Streptosporangiaceae bacterium]